MQEHPDSLIIARGHLDPHEASIISNFLSEKGVLNFVLGENGYNLGLHRFRMGGVRVHIRKADKDKVILLLREYDLNNKSTSQNFGWLPDKLSLSHALLAILIFLFIVLLVEPLWETSSDNLVQKRIEINDSNVFNSN